MGANVWYCNNYEIFKVEERDNNLEYRVTIQRLPESVYKEKTIYSIATSDVDESGVTKFPSGLSLNNFLANVIPNVNTYITAIDAESYTTLT